MVFKKRLKCSTVIKESGVTFGTSGARGLVKEFTPNVSAAFTVAFIQCMKRNFSYQSVALAIDNRPSSYAIAQACSAALEQFGIQTVYYGVLPTPALAYVAMEDSIPSIMVTGSHIPFDRNGLKFYRPDGEITKADEIDIFTAVATFTKIKGLPKLVTNYKATERYINRYTSLFDNASLTGKRIGIYEHSSAGRDIYYRIFEKLGAEVIALGRSNEFVPIDTEAVSEEDKVKALKWSNEYKLDALFSTDGDGDRPLMSDENGNWIRGDILGLLCADALSIESLAVPVSCNTAIELSDKFEYVKRTKIGSPYVIAEFEELANRFNSVAGFEANGGFLLGSDVILNDKKLKALPTRDAILPAIMLLTTSGNKAISTFVKALPKRFTYSDRVQNFTKDKSKMILAKGKLDPLILLGELGFKNVSVKYIEEIDGLRIVLEDEKIIHLRPSGNAPELRCYFEADNDLMAKNCVTNIIEKLKEY